VELKETALLVGVGVGVGFLISDTAFRNGIWHWWTTLEKHISARIWHQSRNQYQPYVAGIMGGMGPKASAMFCDINVVDGRVRLFKAMKECADCPVSRFRAVQAISASNWTSDQVEKVWEMQVGGDKLVKDQDHVAFIMYNNPVIPGRPEFLSGRSTIDPVPAMAHTAQSLINAGVSSLSIVCSTAHKFKVGMLDAVEPANFPFLDMIDLTFEYILRVVDTPDDEILTVGLIGTQAALKCGVYESYVMDLPVELVTSITAPKGKQSNFTQAIFGPKGVKAGYDSDLSCPHTFHNFELLLAEVEALLDAGAQAIILGCTELPLLLTEENLSKYISKNKLFLVNPAQVLADEIIRKSLISRNEHITRYKNMIL